jgi:hypothetical protein
VPRARHGTNICEVRMAMMWCKERERRAGHFANRGGARTMTSPCRGKGRNEGRGVQGTTPTKVG